MTLKPLNEYAYAFLYACLAFKGNLDAENYSASQGKRLGQQVDPLFSTERTCYTLNEPADSFDTGLKNYAGPRNNTKPIWHVLRKSSIPRPEGSYNIALLHEGPSRIFLKDRSCDCYTVWNRDDGSIFLPVWANGKKTLFAARSGTGVMYARMLHYKAGKPDRLDTHCFAIQFQILDKDPAKDDMLRIVVLADRTSYSRCDTPDQPHEPSLDDVSEVVRNMMRNARRGFEKHCRPIDQDVEQRIILFHDQQDKYAAAFNRFTYRFKNNQNGMQRMRRLTTQAVLNWVHEPWQLRMVIETHGYRQEFWEHPHYDGTIAARFARMMEQYKATPERKAELWKMTRDYVEPSFGKQWSYTGD